MIVDLASDDLDAEISADICIVGAGAAGVTLALELSARGRSVVLLESGGLAEEAASQTLSEGESVGHPMALEYGRYRVLGGSTTHWTGRCAKLDPIDFQARDWTPYSGWPFGRDVLESYYARAARYCGFTEPWVADDAIPATLGLTLPAFDPARVEPFAWRYAPQREIRRYRDWGRDYQDDLRQRDNIRVLLHANLVDIEPAPSGERVVAAHAASLNGKRVRVQAESFVLCCGGVENARLLLHAAEAHPHTLIANPDMVGRFFMQHPRGKIAALDAEPATARQLQDMFNVFSRRSGAQYEIGFALPESVQRQERLLNASVILLYEADPQSAWEKLKRAAQARRPESVGDLLGALTNPGEIARNLVRRVLQGRHPVLETRAIDVIIDLEQAPDPDSRLSLADQRDALGLKRVRVDWRIGEMERRTSARFAALLAGEFERLGLGRLRLAPWLDDSGPIPAEALGGTYHHIGATRMAAGAASGVVDSDCKVYGADNLYVQGCSVFPTGGHANPTLTIVAVALRQADILDTAHARAA